MDAKQDGSPADGADATPQDDSDTPPQAADGSEPEAVDDSAPESADASTPAATSSDVAATKESPKVRRPRPPASDPGDPYGEPAWLQPGSGKRTAAGIVLTVVLIAAVSGLGWWLFQPDATPEADGDDPSAVACDVVEHDDAGAVVEVPSGLGASTPRKTATVTTNYGEIRVLMFGDVAPCGVSGFEYIAAQGFYDNSDCHRMTTQPLDPTLTLRCGDPSGDGEGGPGFRFRAEQAFKGQVGADYVALINNRTGEAGSSFAFVRGESIPTASLSVIGQVIAGYDVLDQIAAMTPEQTYDSTPPRPVTIQQIVVEEGAVTLPPTDEPTSPSDSGLDPSDSGDPSGPPSSSGESSGRSRN
ncbi:MAG: peptidylprolyl isomerase [Stackebrandtia sp.]